MGIPLYIVVSTNRLRLQWLNPNVSLNCSAVSPQCVSTKTSTPASQVFSPQRTDSLTRWPIKSNVQQPLLGFMVTFDINHWRPGSAVRFCLQDSSDHSFTLHSKTGVYINAFFWEGTYWTWNCYSQKEKKIASSSNTAGGLFKSVPESMRSKRAKPASGFFLWKKGRKLCWLWSLHCFSSSHEWGLQWFLLGVWLTFWFRQCTFDFDVNPCSFPAQEVGTHQGGMRDMYCISLTLTPCPKSPFRM